MKDEKKPSENINEGMHVNSMENIYYMNQACQMVQPSMPQTNMMYCPYFMNMQCPVMYNQGTAKDFNTSPNTYVNNPYITNTYMSNPYMYNPNAGVQCPGIQY